ncbi:MAG: dihydrolipoamide acetyltransferase family protein [Actinomycetota bacterium]
MAVREFLLPDLGEGLEDAEVVTWHVAEGDGVELNQTLVEVNTAKAMVEIPAPWEGVVEKLHASEGDVVKVGEPLVSIRVEDAAATSDAPEASTGEGSLATDDSTRPKRRAVLVGYGVEEEGTALGPAAARPARPAPAGRRGPVPASPPVRRLARELGVDLSSVTGTGTGGRVTREDVQNAAEQGEGARVAPVAAAGEGVRRIAVKGTRRLIAEKMARAAREVPQVTTFLTVDATALQAFREELSGGSGRRITPLPIVVRALVEVCREHPKLNSSFDAERREILVYERCHVGIATDTEQGLLVPVVREAGSLGLVALSEEIARLTEAARSGKATPQELVGSTITVTNVGTFGAEFGTPIVNHPEAAILALGVVESRALVVDGEVQARPAVTLSLSFDHRVLDGAEAGRAMKALKSFLESPFRLGALPR